MNSDYISEVTYSSVVSLIPRYLPELEEAYQEEIQWWGDEEPAPHVVYDDVFVPFFLDRLQRGDEAGLARATELLELLSSSRDERVQTLVMFTVCENLLFHRDRMLYPAAKSRMGKRTRQLCEDAENHWRKLYAAEGIKWFR
jgi:hypothetical protein